MAGCFTGGAQSQAAIKGTAGLVHLVLSFPLDNMQQFKVGIKVENIHSRKPKSKYKGKVKVQEEARK